MIKIKTFFISDCHFWHTNIIKFENRPFDSIEEMNEKMIEKWNVKVSNHDRVFILGDFVFGNDEKTLDILSKLNGKLYLVKGNHDKFSKKIYEKFEWVKEYYKLKMDNMTIILCHYPFTVWDKSHHNSINLYGHVHGMANGAVMPKPADNQYNVGVEVNNYEPCTLEEIIKNNEIWIKKIWE